MAAELAVAAAIGSFWTMLSCENPVSKGLGKLIEMAGDQIGYRSRSTNNFIRAKSDAEVQLLTVRTEIEIDKIRAVALNEAQITEIYSVEIRAIARETVSRNRKQRNFEQIVVKAAADLHATPDDTVADRKVDADWASQFFGHAEDVGNEELQVLWAKLLASEIKRPGTISRRTLETVKNLTRSDCEIFAVLCSYVWQSDNARDTLVIFNDDWVERPGTAVYCKLQDLLAIIDCGLIENLSAYDDYGIRNSVEKFSYFGVQYEFRCAHGSLLHVRSDAGKFQLTASGKELSKVVTGEPNLTYLENIMEYYRGRGWSILIRQT